MTDSTARPVPEAFRDSANVSATSYDEMYRRSLEDSDSFWAEQANRLLHWFTSWESVQSGSLAGGDARWFEGAKLNAAYNCLDRHLENNADSTALIWEPEDESAENRRFTYRELHDAVCRSASALRGIGVKRGDRVCLYLPMIPEAVISMLACARMGAIHSVVFSGCSPDALRERIDDFQASVVITADQAIRFGRKVPLKARVDIACENLESVKRVVVVRRGGDDVDWKDGRDLWFDDLLRGAPSDSPAAEMGAEDPLFILYTSGATSKPKGVLHTTGGYLVYAALTHEVILDHHAGDVHWCTAELGWITGHTYSVYGPLANGGTVVLFEGSFDAKKPARTWEIVDKYQVNSLYTTPTLIRTLMAQGDSHLETTRRNSLRVLGTVGEPINAEAWNWYHSKVGKDDCPVVDTWWQTETGGIVLSPVPAAESIKPGASAKPFFGIEAGLVDDSGELLEGEATGHLVLSRSWPGQMRSLYGNHDRFVESYLSANPGHYTTGDAAHRDADGHYRITGHVDDRITIAGVTLDTSDVENAITSDAGIAEAAVVAYTRDDGKDGIYAWVTPRIDTVTDNALADALKNRVQESLGETAVPDVIQWAPALPRTRSGKILRRILKQIANGAVDDLGDTTTLADANVVDALVELRQKGS